MKNWPMEFPQKAFENEARRAPLVAQERVTRSGRPERLIICATCLKVVTTIRSLGTAIDQQACRTDHHDADTERDKTAVEPEALVSAS